MAVDRINYEVLEQQTYHLEWALWLGSPWMEIGAQSARVVTM